MIKLTSILAAGAVAVSFLTAPAFATTLTFSTLVNGAQEVPAPIAPSGAVGEATITVDTVAESFDFSLSVIGLDLTDLLDIPTVGPVHLHRGAPGQTGPIVAPFGSLTGPDFSDDFPFVANAIGQISGFSLNVVDFTFGASADFASFLSDLSSGNIYVNIHSLANPAGDIRGDFAGIAPVPLPASVLMLIGGLAGMFSLRRRAQA